MWETEEDFEKDWWALADPLYDPSLSEPTPPISQHLKKARATITRSIYDIDFDDYDNGNVKYCSSSRGSNLESSMVRPGEPYTEKELMKITQNQIREVSGLGYSNELIEQAFGHGGSEISEKTTSSSEIFFEPVKKPICDPKEQIHKSSNECSSSTSKSVFPCSTMNSKHSKSSALMRHTQTPNGRFSQPGFERFGSVNRNKLNIKSMSEFPPL